MFVLCHLEERTIEHAVVPFCEDREIAVVGYSPFGSGRFPSPRSAGGKVLAELAAARDVTPQQLALAFLLRQSEHLFLIPKASQVAHVEANAVAAEIELSAAELGRIDAVFRRGRPGRRLPTL